ncbi:NNP family nitrate/nitrite transporter-like MFS transporter [Kineococcus xinjiangensis]|uniref:NNP family nitrate/nitrite transporter-like MFS transporter n=1 Tax=Kineococcus xinjiangensis TaxID=512762 RepID=A0A2S6IWE2_9ACTN|nr:MFS transporter [Kineococcus xinjiangensis]PPK98605.1 NNP family nitrate/nitrite transporter-like MFS transporter [Kineococcus xinjiangensis]
MATTTDSPATAAVGTVAAPRPGRWIDDFDPEDSAQWETTGRPAARRNLALSIVAEFLGFSVWQLWTIVTPSLGRAGFDLTANQMFWLIAIPNLVGATLRFPYTFAVPRFGGRNWTIVSALLLLVPCAGLAWVVQNPDTPFWLMCLVAATAGVGGGNFASSMANISFFYPEREKGAALGLNAAGGNLGVAVVQLAVPLVVISGAGIALERAGIVFIPLVVLSAVLAWKHMDNLSSARADLAGYAAAVKDRHTWIVSFLYIGTFGSFIGYAGVFPTLIGRQFPEIAFTWSFIGLPGVPLTLAFLGALVGSLARPYGGRVADRLGGARVSIAAYAVMVAGALGVVAALRSHSFALFFGSFMVLFIATGMGNGSVYRMIPAIFRAGVDTSDRLALTMAKREAAACIGIAAGIGGYGGFLIPRGFAMSLTQFGSLAPALLVFIGFYVVCIAVTWSCYLRRTGTRFADAVV